MFPYEQSVVIVTTEVVDVLVLAAKRLFSHFPNPFQAALVGSSVYVMGGFDGQSRDALFRLRLPFDVCAIYGGDKKVCVFSMGCSACKLAADPNKVAGAVKGAY